MSPSEIRHLERYLEFHREEILVKLRRDHDVADANSSWNGRYGSSTGVLKDYLLRSQEQIEAALIRIREGTYGKCVACGNEIGLRALAVVPWTQFCAGCQEQSDKLAG